MTITETSVLITDAEKVTSEKDILARGRQVLEAANPGEKVGKVTLVGTDVFDEYKAYHFQAEA